MGTAKADALAMIEKLPDDATWEQVCYHMYLRAEIERGMADIEAGRVVPHEQVMREMDEWLASLGQQMPVEGSPAT